VFKAADRAGNRHAFDNRTGLYINLQDLRGLQARNKQIAFAVGNATIVSLGQVKSSDDTAGVTIHTQELTAILRRKHRGLTGTIGGGSIGGNEIEVVGFGVRTDSR